MTVSLNYRIDHVIKNKYSRPGIKLNNVLGIVIHYTANPKATAQNHQDFFDGEDGGGGRYAGAHIFVDKHEAIEIIPLDEVAYHANDHRPRLSFVQGNANFTTVAIEMCIEADGSFHPETVARTVLVVKELQKRFPHTRDTRNRVVRHYDVTGKLCPKPYVINPFAWTAFKNRVDEKTVVNHTETKSETAKQYVSIVTYLNDHGKDSSYSAREKLAKQYGISGYHGTAEQNTRLLELLQNPPKPKSKPKSKLPNEVYRAKKPYPHGAGVKAVQEALASVYFYPDKDAPNHGIDGYYGPDTADAVRRFQLTHGLKDDGVYGPKTKARLEKEIG